VRSRLFCSEAYLEVADRARDVLNSQGALLSPATADSPRAVGDAIEAVLAETFETVLGEWCAEYSADFARRAMADLAFSDTDGLYYVVDVKTHREDARFSMPNLTSVERLTRFYEDDSNYFVVLLVRYRVDGTAIDVAEVVFAPIEFLDWGCLTIGALGWGQIQIANSNRVEVIPGNSRKSWMLTLCDAVLDFYPREVTKIEARIERFEEVRRLWKGKPD